MAPISPRSTVDAGVPELRLSFIYVASTGTTIIICFIRRRHVDGAILWANLHLLFWLSLMPFATGWMGENHFAPIADRPLWRVLLMAAIAYTILQRAIIAKQGRDSLLAGAVGGIGKENILSFVMPWPSPFLREPMACRCVICACGGHVVHSPSPNRAHAGST